MGCGKESSRNRGPTSGVVSLQFVDERKKTQARQLRSACTPAEKWLWHHLRNRKIDGLKFRRQQVIEGFVADFFCEEARLVIEVDGAIHDEAKQKKIDAHRERVFAARGIETLRLRNGTILNSIEECLLKIAVAAEQRLVTKQAPLRAERGGRRPG